MDFYYFFKAIILQKSDFTFKIDIKSSPTGISHDSNMKNISLKAKGAKNSNNPVESPSCARLARHSGRPSPTRRREF